MDEDIDNSLVGYLSIITDPRIERGRRHNLIDILVIACVRLFVELKVGKTLKILDFLKRIGLKSF
jgi:hypothetical protein